MTDFTRMTDDQLAERPFDELVTELQRIVAKLESGNAGLEESIELYREGLRLHAACEVRLQRAELAIADLGRGAGETPAAESTDDGPGTAGGSE